MHYYFIFYVSTLKKISKEQIFNFLFKKCERSEIEKYICHTFIEITTVKINIVKFKYI